MLHEGLVSTIIPVFNRSALLREAVVSVLAQTYRPIEIIIVDDGSTDDTPATAAELAARHPVEIRLIRRPNGGPGAAREAGRIEAQGEFIQYLDSDDILLPRKFELQVAGLRAAGECGVAYGMTRYYSIGETPGDQPWKRTGEPIATMFPSFLQSRWWDTSTPLYRRKITDHAGPWLALRNEEDWEYDCRIASQGVRLHHCAAFVSDTRAHGGDMLSNTVSKGQSAKLKNRAEAHQLILRHAQAAGIAKTTPEMQHFARELFLLARQCGAAGLTKESAELFRLARGASTDECASARDFSLYGLAARIAGWRIAGRIACRLDAFRR